MRLRLALYYMVLAGVLGGVANAQGGGIVLQTKQIPAGTPILVKALQSISSETARIGDPVKVVVSSEDKSGLPPNSVLVGQVTNVRPATAKNPGILDIQFGAPKADSSSDSSSASVTDAASVHLVGQTAQTANKKSTGIGAAVGALLGFSRKAKIGDAITGAALGGVGGYAVGQAQKRAGGDIKVAKDSEITVKLDKSQTIRTELVPNDSSYY